MEPKVFIHCTIVFIYDIDLTKHTFLGRRWVKLLSGQKYFYLVRHRTLEESGLESNSYCNQKTLNFLDFSNKNVSYFLASIAKMSFKSFQA